LVPGWRRACRSVAHGATTCACRATNLGVGVLGSINTIGVDRYAGLPRHVWTVTQAQWRDRTALPRLSFKGSSMVARSPRPEATGTATSNYHAMHYSAATLATGAMRCGAAEEATRLGSSDVTM
jgi:hypothetical protein